MTYVNLRYEHYYTAERRRVYQVGEYYKINCEFCKWHAREKNNNKMQLIYLHAMRNATWRKIKLGLEICSTFLCESYFPHGLKNVTVTWKLLLKHDFSYYYDAYSALRRILSK